MDDQTQENKKDISKSRLTGLFDDIANKYHLEDDHRNQAHPQYAPPNDRHETNLDEDEVPPADSFAQPTIIHGQPIEEDVNATIAGEATPVGGITCPFCHTKHQSDDKFCRNCGKPLLLNNIEFCRVCKTPLIPDAKYCFYCGSNVSPIAELVLHQIEGNMSFILRGEKSIYLVGRNVPEQHNYVDIDLGPLGQRKVSRQHARIVIKENQWYVEDLNSKGGTLIFNNRIQPQTPALLEDGMVLYFADVKFKVALDHDK